MRKNIKALGRSFAFLVIWVAIHPTLLAAYQAAPVAYTKNPTFITEKSVTMNGSVNSNEMPDTYAWFEWGISGRSAVYETPHRQVGAGTVLMDFNSSVHGLAPNVQYFYRQVAESSRGRDVGVTTYFTTQKIAESIDPYVIVQTNTPVNVYDNSAVLRGYIAPHEGQSVRWWFEYGTTNKLGNTTQTSNWGTDSDVAKTNITNLTSGTVYFYRIAAENTQGVVYGGVMSFTTKGIAPSLGEAARTQSLPTPQAGSGAAGSGGMGSAQAGGGGYSANYGAASASGLVIPGPAYFPPAALNFQNFTFNSIFGNKKVATNNGGNSSVTESNTQNSPTPNGNSNQGVSGSMNTNTQLAGAAATTPLGTFWNTLTGKKIAEVKIDKIGPNKTPAHTPVEYRITYTYRRANPATNAKLKIILPGSVVYIGDNTTNELLLEDGVGGGERTYILPVGKLEKGTTRTISILGMTTSEAENTFPSARARLEYTLSTGEVEVVSAEGSEAATSLGATANPSSSFSFFPSSLFGWMLYVLIITLIIVAGRKLRAYYNEKKTQLAQEAELEQNLRKMKQVGSGPILA